MVSDSSGTLHGTTQGGSNAVGTVFKLTAPPVEGQSWTEKVLYSFNGVPDGANPIAGAATRPAGFTAQRNTAVWAGESRLSWIRAAKRPCFTAPREAQTAPYRRRAYCSAEQATFTGLPSGAARALAGYILAAAESCLSCRNRQRPSRLLDRVGAPQLYGRSDRRREPLRGRDRRQGLHSLRHHLLRREWRMHFRPPVRRSVQA